MKDTTAVLTCGQKEGSFPTLSSILCLTSHTAYSCPTEREFGGLHRCNGDHYNRLDNGQFQTLHVQLAAATYAATDCCTTKWW